MANKWAIQNGNWSDGSTWNDGVVPTDGDLVYANNHTVTVAQNSTEVNGKTLSNESTDINGVAITAGGYFAIRQTIQTYQLQFNVRSVTTRAIQWTLGANDLSATLIGNIYAKNTKAIEFPMNQRESVTFIGDISLDSGAIYSHSAVSSAVFSRISIIGDVVCNGTCYIQMDNYITDLTLLEVVGNMTNIRYTTDTTKKILTANITGILSINFDFTIDTLSISGKLKTDNCSVLCSNTTTIDGSVEYISSSSFGSIGLAARRITVVNPETFYWRDITSVRDNPFIIYSDADLEDTANYPTENNVRKDVVYALGTKIGTYLPDYPSENNVKEGVTYDSGRLIGTYNPSLPQEANVLKDVHYGDNQVGTLEVIALSGATATADNISVVNLTEQEINRVKNCATVSTVQKCFEDFKEE